MADMQTDTEADGRWLSFNELAQLRGISRASAARLVRRHRWRRQADNKGGVRIFVPLEVVEAADSPPDSQTVRPPDTKADAADIAHIVRVLEAALTSLKESGEAEREALKGQIAVERERADREAARANALELAQQLRRARSFFGRLKAVVTGD